tara:strand:+ start:123 stop:365 length:243 start_codon:yes stop_codon:yes gene_type:complete
MKINNKRLKQIIKEEIYKLSETGEITKAAVDAAKEDAGQIQAVVNKFVTDLEKLADGDKATLERYKGLVSLAFDKMGMGS